MSSQTRAPEATRGVSQWAVGFSLFAAVLMILGGVYQAVLGITAVLKDDIVLDVRNYPFEFDITAWGWLHLIVGITMALAGFAIVSGRLWGRVVGIILALLSAIANFLYLPYYPLWAILIIAMDVLVIWALSAYEAPR